MIEILERDKCKLMDKIAIEGFKIPGIILMENAARSVHDHIINKGKSFLIICGKGNNGGDGLVIARHLILSDKQVKIYIIGDSNTCTNDFKINLEILKNITNNIYFIDSEEVINNTFIEDIKDYDITLDCMFGVGLNRDIDGIYKIVIDNINKYSNLTISVDIPSGLDTNLGIPRGVAINADVTYSFEVIKKGFLNYEAMKYVGQLNILKIGIPKKVTEKISDKIYILNDEEYKEMLPKREIYGHKGNYGRALIIAGSKGFTGAAFITTECTVRTGAGLTTLACPSDVQDILSNKLVESMTTNFEDKNFKSILKNADCIAVGPGIGIGKKKSDLLKQVIEESTCPLVIDADGIKLLQGNDILLKKIRGRAIITPHPGEMAYLLNKTIKEVENDRVKIAIETAREYGVVVLLKGYNTVISDGEKVYINPTGNSKMASGGMGDALTGIINGLLSQKSDLMSSALLGAYVHGKIADKLSKNQYVVNARDVIESISEQLNDISKS